MAKYQQNNKGNKKIAGSYNKNQDKEPITNASSSSVSSNAPKWLAAAVALVGCVLYANTLFHDFTLDDFGAIKENWIVKSGFKNWGLLWSSEYRFGSWASPGSLYRPLTLAMFSIEWQIKNGPMIGHLFNILYYGLTGYVLWNTLRRVLSDYSWTLAALTTLLFMAHPVHTEVVANIKSRDEIISLLCGISAINFLWRYFENDDKKWLYSALGIYGLGMFAKESGITFLAVFPLTMWFFSKRPLGEIIKIAALFVIPASVFLAIRYKVLSAQNYTETYSILDNFIVGAKTSASRFASALMMCWEYLRVLIFPHPLVSDRGYPQLSAVTFSDWRAIAGALTYFGMGIWALMNMGKKHILSYAILIYLVTFSLFSNVIILIGTSYGERLLYAPSLGFALALSWILHRFFGNLDKTQEATFNNTTLWTVAGIILAAFAFKTMVRNQAWNNSYTLYEADYPTSPNCAKLNYHRSLEINNNGLDKEKETVNNPAMIEDAIKAYTRTIELYPEYHDAYGSRGLAHFRLQQYDKAFNDYQIALKHRPNDAKVLSNMGFIYFLRAQRPGNQLATSELDSAENVYRRSIQYDPRFVDARRNLGAVLAMKRKFPPAIEQWKEGLKYEPNNPTLNFYIGSAHCDMGDKASAQPWFDKARQLDPKLGPQIDQKMMAPTVVQQPVVQQPVAQQPPKTEDKGGIFPPKKK
jgi:tetratricopeptide (TPR) repeat protein